MKIYRPVKSDHIFQKFGENKACTKLGSDNKPIRPFQVIGTNTDNVCPIGYTSFYAAIGMKGHNGVDSQTYHGEPIYFPVDAPGIQWEAATEVDQDGGIGVRVRSTTPVALDHLPPQAVGSLNMIQTQYAMYSGAVYLEFLFWHLLTVDVYDKKPIKLGDRLGWADSTGASAGDHLHWALKISSDTSWFTLDGDNGYTGAIDFMDWFDNRFVLDIIAPPSPTTNFKFNITMLYGQTSNDVGQLQERLQKEGYFPIDQPPTRYYGTITARAVLEYQLAHKVDTVAHLMALQGKSCGPITRAELNK